MTILTLPPAHRADYTGIALTRDVIDVLRVIERTGGRASFDTASRRLLISLAAIIAHEEGHERLVELLDVAEAVN